MENMMSSFALAPFAEEGAATPGTRMLAIDVKDAGDKLVIHADVPGLAREDVKARPRSAPCNALPAARITRSLSAGAMQDLRPLRLKKPGRRQACSGAALRYCPGANTRRRRCLSCVL